MYRIPALIHVKWNLFAERNRNTEPFPAGRSMSAPTEVDVRDSEIRGGLPRQERELARNDREIGFAMTGKSALRHCTTERYRAAQGRNDYTYLAHDLAARHADKFQFVSDNG